MLLPPERTEAALLFQPSTGGVASLLHSCLVGEEKGPQDSGGRVSYMPFLQSAHQCPFKKEMTLSKVMFYQAGNK